MWVDRESYQRQELALARAQEASRILSEQNRAQQVTLDWFRVRITQLEVERAQLLYNYTGVKVPTPVIESAPSEAVAAALSRTPIFQDMGDAEANSQGIGWDANGEIRYGVK